MKTLILLALLGFGAWYFLNKTPEGQQARRQVEDAKAEAQKAQNAAVDYTKNLQKSVEKAKEAQAAAEASMKKAAKQLEELK
jgi:uncharacterized protein HemX